MINYKNIPQKIMKLEKYFECQNESKNIFLICFPFLSLKKDGEAKISFEIKVC